MSTIILENSDAVQHAAALVGEYSDNYIVICTNPEYGNGVELRTPNTISAEGLLRIALAYCEQQNSIEDDFEEFYWEEEEVDESDDDDSFLQ